MTYRERASANRQFGNKGVTISIVLTQRTMHGAVDCVSDIFSSLSNTLSNYPEIKNQALYVYTFREIIRDATSGLQGRNFGPGATSD